MVAQIKSKGRVGIVTYIRSANYGSALQAFALQECVSSMGYDSYLIDWLDLSSWRNRAERYMHIASQLLWTVKAPRASLRLRLHTGHSRAQTQKKQQAFASFEKRCLRFMGGDYAQPSAFDAFICGSDQVWSLSMPGLHRTFFLRFAPPTKRIAYAPSFGADSVPRHNRKILSRYLRGMAYISVRERSGVQIVKEATGRDAPCVLDPVLLAGEEFWQNRTARPITDVREPYVLAYLLSDNKPAYEQIKRYAESRGARLVWVESGVPAPSGAEMVTPDPMEFVSLVVGASGVATDSFHGLAFSLLFRRSFMLINRAYESNSAQGTRMESLLELALGQKGSVDGLVRIQVDDTADTVWQLVSSRLERERAKSGRYLASALEDVCKRRD